MSEEVDDTVFFIFLIMTIIYSVVAFFAFLRNLRLRQFDREWKTARIFYIVILIQALLRCFFFLAISLRASTINNIMAFLLLTLPQCMFTANYILLFWQMVAVFYYSLIGEDTYSSLLRNRTRNPGKSLIGTMVLCFEVLYVTSQLTVYILLMAYVLSPEEITFEIAICDVTIPTLVLAIILFLYIQYSGVPTISNTWMTRGKRITMVTLLWTFTRYLTGITSFLYTVAPDGIASDIGDHNNNLSIIATTVLVLVLMISEVFCLITVLDYGVVEIFLMDQLETPQSQDVSLESMPSVEARRDFCKQFDRIQEEPISDEAFIQIQEPLQSRHHGLGKVFRATYHGVEIFYRLIEYGRLGNFVLTEFAEEVQNQEKQIGSVLPVLCYYLKPPKIGIAWPYFAKGSLYKNLHVDRIIFSMEQKIKIILNVLQSLEQLHSRKKAHGHLTSHNILLDETNFPYISDQGLLIVKKYAGIQMGYTNKSSWSSPELLKEKRLVFTKAHSTDDIWSIGMILWELATEQEPFPGYSRNRLYQTLVVENERPYIPQDVPDDLRMIILSCWNSDHRLRPTASNLVGELNVLVG